MRRSQPLGLSAVFDRFRWSLRRRLRSPFLYWLLAATIGVLTTSALIRTFDEAQAQRDRYGRWVTVSIAVSDLPAGHTVTGDDVRQDELPAAMVPRSAWREPPIGTRLRTAVVAGEVLLESRTRVSNSSLAAQLEPGRRAIAVPVPMTALGVRPGDRVEVIALDATSGVYTTAADDTWVLAATDGLVTLDVAIDDVAAVAGAVAGGTAQLTLSGA